MKSDMIRLVYVDYAILAVTNKQYIGYEIKTLGVSFDERSHELGLRDEGKIGDFLGIRIEKTGKSQLNLTQTTRIKKDLTQTEITYRKSVLTPEYTTYLELDTDRTTFNESWK